MVTRFYTKRFIDNQCSHYKASGRKGFHTERIDYKDAYSDCIADIKSEFAKNIAETIDISKTYEMNFNMWENRSNGVTVISAECIIKPMGGFLGMR